jgi:hypothetical protein
MKTLLVVLTLASFSVFASDAVDDIYSPVPEYTGLDDGGPIWNGPFAVIYNNGPFVNSPGTGPGGSDESVMNTGESTFGFGCQHTLPNRVTDDFTIASGATWTINTVTLFGYQTGSTTTPTINGSYITIYSGDTPTSGTIVYGNYTTNVQTGAAFTNCYRVQTTGSGTTRPVMALTCTLTGCTLPAGHYWLAWDQTGTLSSGPWANPITITGQPTTGNAWQYTQTTGAWAAIVMGGTNAPQGLPFILDGTTTGLVRDTWGSIKTIF